jgi:hypothetical protein
MKGVFVVEEVVGVSRWFLNYMDWEICVKKKKLQKVIIFCVA